MTSQPDQPLSVPVERIGPIDYRGASIALVYEHVRGVNRQQYDAAVNLDSKAATIQGVTTAIVGIGVPLGISQIPTITPVCFGVAMAFLAIVPILLYVRGLLLFIEGYRLRPFQFTESVTEMRTKKVSELGADDFYRTMLIHIEGCFNSNQEQLDKKAPLVQELFVWSMWVNGVVVGWSFLLMTGTLITLHVY